MTACEGSTKKLSALLKRLRSKYEPGPEAPIAPEGPDAFDAAVHQLVYSMLLWEASSSQARAALRRLRENLVDFNELRVCMPDEIGLILGEKYPRSRERSLRMRSVLTDLSRRCQQLSLQHLVDQPKRESRAFLDALDGMPRFVSSRVMLLSFSGHATPCDDRLRDLLVQERVIATGATAEAVGSWLEHHIRAEDAAQAHAALQAWSDDVGGVVRATKPAKAKPKKTKARPGA